MVYLLDPLVATGGTAVAAINMLTDWGLTGMAISVCKITTLMSRILVDNIRLLSVLASQEGLHWIQSNYVLEH